MNFYSSQQTIKLKAPDSPVKMGQQDINEVLTTIAASPSSPILGGYAQRFDIPPDDEDICLCCGKICHDTVECPNSPVSQNIICFCCGRKGHTTIECPRIELLPTPISTPTMNNMPHQPCWPRQ